MNLDLSKGGIHRVTKAMKDGKVGPCGKNDNTYFQTELHTTFFYSKLIKKEFGSHL